MGKPLNSLALLRPISFTSCVSTLIEHIILSRLLFFLESNSLFSPRQADSHPGRSTLDQILFLSQSISDGFNKLRPGFWTILSTTDYSKSFDSGIHSSVFSGWRRTDRNSSTYRFPRFPPRNLCSLVTLALSSIVFAATNTAFCLALISSGFTELRILLEAPADTCPRTPLISFCAVQLRTLCAARSRSLYDFWSRSWGVARLLGLHGLPPCPHPLEGIWQQQHGRQSGFWRRGRV